MKQSLAEKATTPIGLIAVILYMLGISWDTQVHVQKGHTLLEPAHLVVFAGYIGYMLCGFLAFKIRCSVLKIDRKVKNSLSIITIGAVLVPLGAISDELWHKFLGEQTTAWSPPHIVLFGSAVLVSFGICLLVRTRAMQNKKCEALANKLIPCIFLVMLFFSAYYICIDYDTPGLSYLEHERQGFLYPYVMSSLITFLVTIGVLILKLKPRYIVTASFIAWFYIFSAGILLDTIDINATSPKLFPPFAAFVPMALTAPLAFKMVENQTKKLFRLTLFVFILSSAFYWSIVGWATLYTKLPQQISGTPKDWLLWYIIFVPSFAAACAVLESLISKWTAANK